MIEKKKQQFYDFSGDTALFQMKMTKEESDIFWKGASQIRYKVWCDGGYIKLYDPLNAKNQFVISLTLYHDGHLEDFVVKRGHKYGEDDIARVDPRAQQALRAFLIELGFYKGVGCGK